MINKILIPSDPALFKKLLLITKQAKRTLIYTDGSVKVEMWDANKFTSNSNIMNNISSQLWHRKDKTYIVKAIYEIEEHDNLKLDEFVKCYYPSTLYIHYMKGYSSFIPAGKYVSGYTIEDDVITILYNVGFNPEKTERKKISLKDMRELCSILEEAYVVGDLGKSNTLMKTIHGPICTYDYDYRDQSGKNCGALINDAVLMGRYHDLINRLT